MATTADGRISYDSGGAGEKFRKRPFLLPDLNEEPVNDQETRQNNSSEVSLSELGTHECGNCSASITGISENEQILKQKTFTRCETQHLISLLHSRACDNAVVERNGAKPPLSRFESSTSGSLKRPKHGDGRDNFHAAGVISRVPITSFVSRQQATTTMEKLPDELLSNIFIRLLAKQLAQMRSVSKSWNALLSQPSFIKSHLHHSIHNNHNNSERKLLAFYEKTCLSSSEPFTIQTYPPSDIELTNSFIKLPVNPQFRNANVIRVIGSVNGLICYSHSDSVIHIWNPSLSAVLTLPPYFMPSSHNHDSIKIYFRFGFDPKTDDYKVVKLTAIVGHSKYTVEWWLPIEIYSMRKGTWELVNRRFPSHIKQIIVVGEVCGDGHDGYLHWLGYTCHRRVLERIVVFDLGSETFYEIALPNNLTRPYTALGVLSRKICVMSWDGDISEIEVWVMEEYGVAESWVKRHVFSQFVSYARPYGFTSHNEFLIEDKGHLTLYDPISNKVTVFEKYQGRCFCQRAIVEYVDSLVWVAPAKRT